MIKLEAICLEIFSKFSFTTKTLKNEIVSFTLISTYGKIKVFITGRSGKRHEFD